MKIKKFIIPLVFLSLLFLGRSYGAFDGTINSIILDGADTPQDNLVITVEIECTGNPISQSSMSVDLTCDCDTSWTYTTTCHRNIRMSSGDIQTHVWTIPASSLPCQGNYTACVYWDRSNNCARGNLIAATVCTTDYSVPSLGKGIFLLFFVLAVISYWRMSR